MNEGKKTNLKENILCIVFGILCLGFFLYRLMRGVDTTDESYYMTLAYRLVQGNVLFYDVWDISSTFSVIPAFFLYIYYKIFGSFAGCVLFSRFVFFVLNSGIAALLFLLFRKKYGINWALLLSMIYLFYAPFSIYTNSYNNYVVLFSSLVILLIQLGKDAGNNKYYFLAGAAGALLVFAYPTMILFAPLMILMLLIQKKNLKKAWLFLTLGGLSTAVIMAGILLAVVGYRSIAVWVSNLLGDPVYGESSLLQSVLKSMEYIFYPITKSGLLIKLFFVYLFAAGQLARKYPSIRLSVLVYPIIILLDMYPFQETQEAYATGNYIFFLAFLGPFLIAFMERYKSRFLQILYYEWLPAFLVYMIIAASSYGGAGQGTYALIFAALTTVQGFILIAKEVHENQTNGAKSGRRWICRISVSVMLCIAVLGELWIYGSVVYRDEPVNQLDYQVKTGPYKGLYTTNRKGQYLAELESVMSELNEQGRTALVLYHCNYAYLFLDMMPKTPTVWGLYPMDGMDNQQNYLNYFSVGPEYIPDYIYIVNNPIEYDYDGQREEYYSYANRLNAFVDLNYEYVCEEEFGGTGSVKKYQLVSTYEDVLAGLRMINLYATFKKGFYDVNGEDYMGGDQSAELILTNANKESSHAAIHFTIEPVTDAPMTLWITYGGRQEGFTVEGSAQDIEVDLDLVPGDNTILLYTNAEENLTTGTGEPIYYYIKNISVNAEN